MSFEEDEDLEEQGEIPHFPLADYLDNEILMQRDAHFGGDFSTMIDYYKKGGRGTSSLFSLKRIEELAALEKGSGQNLALSILSSFEMERVALSKALYQELRDLYETTSLKSDTPRLIADLILAEEEVELEEAMEAIIAKGSAVIPALLDILKNENFHDPLFPGYGLAPEAAIYCLGRIGDKRTIGILFGAIGEDDFANEDIILDALKKMGEPAKEFLLRVVQGRPFNQDNEKAAIALLSFKEDSLVSQTCLELLQNEEVRKHPALAAYLILVCEGLKDRTSQQIFQELAVLPGTSKEVRQDIEMISKSWKEG